MSGFGIHIPATYKNQPVAFAYLVAAVVEPLGDVLLAVVVVSAGMAAEYHTVGEFA